MGRYTDLARSLAEQKPQEGEPLPNIILKNKINTTHHKEEQTPPVDPSSGVGTPLRSTTLTTLLECAPREESGGGAAEHRDKLREAAALLSEPPGWLAQLFDLYWSEHDSPVKLTSPATGKAETYMVHVSIKNIAAAVAAEIGMPVLEWERIRSEVEEALGTWRAA